MARQIPNAPSRGIWILGSIAGLLGLASRYVDIPEVSTYQFELLAAGFVLLLLGTTFRNI
ncbi:MAG: hypothetical protein AAFO07_20625 [Bacteroidota bacterium]